MKSMLLAAVASAGVLTAECAQAEVDVDQTGACILAAIPAGDSGVSCVAEAHAECLSATANELAVGTLCFVNARESWSEGIAGLMAKVKERAPEEIAAIAGIEVKYDLLSGLLQCDRIEELSRAASQIPGEEIVREKARCEATATGLVYARLFWRTRDLP